MDPHGGGRRERERTRSEDRRRSASERVRGKARAVVARAGQRGEQIAGAHLTAVEVDAGDLRSAACERRSEPP